MAPAAPASHDSAMSHAAPAVPAPQPAQSQAGIAANFPNTDVTSLQLAGLDQTQIMNLLRSLPGVVFKVPTEQGQGNPKEDAAQTLSNLAQGSSPFGTLQYPPSSSGLPGINDPGPSSHPRGPPNLGQLSAVAMQAAPVNVQPGRQDAENASTGSVSAKEGDSSEANQGNTTTAPTSGRRSGRSATMGSDEWSRQRKDNHKEVERRRRGNINEGINELGRIVPSGSGEKAKGAILSRAVQYIHHLKENEARNIEKWTLEKLLMDQAMGDLQAQLEEIKRLWEEERMARGRLEAEIEALRNMNGISAAKDEGPSAGTKRRSTDGTEAEAAASDGKRQRTE